MLKKIFVRKPNVIFFQKFDVWTSRNLNFQKFIAVEEFRNIKYEEELLLDFWSEYTGFLE